MGTHSRVLSERRISGIGPKTRIHEALQGVTRAYTLGGAGKEDLLANESLYGLMGVAVLNECRLCGFPWGDDCRRIDLPGRPSLAGWKATPSQYATSSM